MAKELTELQQSFLKHLQGDAKGDIKTAMMLAGYSPNTHIKDVITALKDEIQQVGELVLTTNIVKGVYGIVDALDDPTRPGANVRLAASRELLDRVGMGKKEQTNVNVRLDGVLILPAKDQQKIINGRATQIEDNPMLPELSDDFEKESVDIEAEGV